MKLLLLSIAIFVASQTVIAKDIDQVISVDSYGAIANDSSVEAAVKNSQAISQALQNASLGSTVLVPKYSNYYIFSVYAVGLKQVQLRIEGKLIAISNITAWPVMDGDYQSVLYFPNCLDFTLTGPGTIDGQGYRWWVELCLTFSSTVVHILSTFKTVSTF